MPSETGEGMHLSLTSQIAQGAHTHRDPNSRLLLSLQVRNHCPFKSTVTASKRTGSHHSAQRTKGCPPPDARTATTQPDMACGEALWPVPRSRADCRGQTPGGACGNYRHRRRPAAAQLTSAARVAGVMSSYWYYSCSGPALERRTPPPDRHQTQYCTCGLRATEAFQAQAPQNTILIDVCTWHQFSLGHGLTSTPWTVVYHRTVIELSYANVCQAHCYVVRICWIVM